MGFVLALAMMFLPQKAAAQILTVDLGTASNFAILASSGTTNAGVTTVTGDVGSSPTATIANSGTFTLIGTDHGGDPVTLGAKNDLDTAYNDAVTRTPTTIYGAIFDLGGLTLTSGVYNDPSSFGIAGTLTLDGQNNPDAVWIFQAGSTLSTGANSAVVLINGAQASNIFWQIGSSATLGANTQFAGTMLAFTSITLGSGTTVNGRTLAEGGAVALTQNTISLPVSVAPEPGTTLLLGLGLVTFLVFRRRSFSSGSIVCQKVRD